MNGGQAYDREKPQRQTQPSGSSQTIDWQLWNLRGTKLVPLMWVTVIWPEPLGVPWQSHQDLSQLNKLSLWSTFSVVGYLAQSRRRDLVLPEVGSPDLIDPSRKALSPLKSECRISRVGNGRKGGRGDWGGINWKVNFLNKNM